jgi:hypothetical protein
MMTGNSSGNADAGTASSGNSASKEPDANSRPAEALGLPECGG